MTFQTLFRIFFKNFHYFLRTISRLSQDFLLTFSGLSQNFLKTLSGLSQDFSRFSTLSEEFPRNFQRIFQEFLRSLTGTFQEYLRNISGISQEILRNISGELSPDWIFSRISLEAFFGAFSELQNFFEEKIRNLCYFGSFQDRLIACGSFLRVF